MTPEKKSFLEKYRPIRDFCCIAYNPDEKIRAFHLFADSTWIYLLAQYNAPVKTTDNISDRDECDLTIIEWALPYINEDFLNDYTDKNHFSGINKEEIFEILKVRKNCEVTVT